MMSRDAQKTVVAFVAGLLIGGLLMWVFASPSGDSALNSDTDSKSTEKTDNKLDSKSNTSTQSTNTAPKTSNDASATAAKPSQKGVGTVTVKNQVAGSAVVLSSVTFPNDEGWVGVRDYQNGQLGGLLGVARFSAEQGLSPTQIELLRGTVAGNDYAIVFHSESGDRQFSLANDVQLSGEPVVFTAK